MDLIALRGWGSFPCSHDLVTGGLYDAHTGSSLGETLDEAMDSAELLSFGLSESSELT